MSTFDTPHPFNEDWGAPDAGKVTPFGKPPRFCSVDGKNLVDRHVLLPMGFDPFTGKPRPALHRITRECPTWAPPHDVWLDGNGFWVKQ